MPRTKRRVLPYTVIGMLLILAILWSALLFIPRSNQGYRLKVPAGYGISSVSRTLEIGRAHV